MKRVSMVTLCLLVPAALTLALPACSSDTGPDDPGGSNQSGSGNNTAGSPSSGTTAGTGSSAAGSGSGSGGASGTSGGSAGGASGAATTAGGGGAGGAAVAGAGGVGGAVAGASTGGSAGASGGTGNANCPVKIDSKVMCTAAVTCNDAYCGVFKLGSKDCTCAGATGFFDCSSCDYAGKTEEIVVPPAAPLAACTADDMTLEATTGCTKGMRCRSTDAAKVRFCACWDDPTKGGTVWDCDSMPSAWPK